MRRSLFVLCMAAVGCGENATPTQSKPPYQAPSQAPLSCVPNLDGQIEASELSATFDVPVSYLVSPPGEERGVDLEGKPDGSGGFVIDWAADYATDRTATIKAAALGEQWFAGQFPEGQFVAPSDAGSTVLGVYSRSDEALLLWGVASALEEPPEGKTLLAYTTPITLYQFPIAPGATWVSVGEIKNGTIRGLVYAGKDTYETKVDGVGELRLPDLTFKQAMRVRTKVVLQPVAGETVITRQTSFLFECFGEVARAQSLRGESEERFTKASEVRRLGL